MSEIMEVNVPILGVKVEQGARQGDVGALGTGEARLEVSHIPQVDVAISVVVAQPSHIDGDVGG